MANKPLKTIKFPGLDDTYTIPQKTSDITNDSGFQTDEDVSDAISDNIDDTLSTTGKSADAKAVGDKIAELETESMESHITNTSSGSIASFTDGADDIPVKDLTFHIEPVQDLHGYDHPWPAGGGVNQNNPNAPVETFDLTGEGVYRYGHSFAGGISYVIVNQNTQNLYFRIVKADMSDRGTTQTLGSNTYRTVNVASDEILWVFGTTPSDWLSIASNVAVNVGSVTTYAPYSNICPISGWTGANVVRTGKNLYCGTKATDFSIIYGGKNNAAKVIDEDYTFKPGIYRVSFELEGTSTPSMFFSTKVNGVWSNPVNRGQVTTFTFTVPENCEHLEIWAYGGSVTALKNVQIELGSAAATAYEPYQGTTIPITLPQEAGTVYGGTLDVVSGELVVDRAMYTFDGTEAWKASSTPHRFSTALTYLPYPMATPPMTTGAVQNALTSVFGQCVYKNEDGVGYLVRQQSGDIFVVNISTATTIADIKNITTGMQLVYELATPQTYQLDPTEVKSILGLNNVWADCGETEVEYRADTKLYIDGKIAELQALILENGGN